MRRIIFLIIFSLLLAGCSGESRKESSVKSRSEQELLASYLDYHRHKDLAGSLSLFYLQDTPPFVLDSVKQRLLKNFAFTITSAKIEEIPPDKLTKVMAGFPFNDKILVPNLQPLKQIAFQFDQTGQTEDMRAAGGSIMFGKIDNICYFVLSKEKGGGAK